MSNEVPGAVGLHDAGSASNNQCSPALTVCLYRRRFYSRTLLNRPRSGILGAYLLDDLSQRGILLELDGQLIDHLL
jgi:hypothetical protein